MRKVEHHYLGLLDVMTLPEDALEAFAVECRDRTHAVTKRTNYTPDRGEEYEEPYERCADRHLLVKDANLRVQLVCRDLLDAVAFDALARGPQGRRDQTPPCFWCNAKNIAYAQDREYTSFIAPGIERIIQDQCQGSLWRPSCES